MKFPEEKRLLSILEAFFPDTSDAVAQKAVSKFLEVRKDIENDQIYSYKNVSTSELIDWFRAITSAFPGEQTYLRVR